VTLRERKRQQTKERIQDEAFRLVQQRGFDATTIEAIAEASDVSPSTVYRYFGTKEGVLLWDELEPPSWDVLRNGADHVARELDAFLSDKEQVARELAGLIRERASAFGLETIAFGIRDIILPGEMKAILNRVTEAKKAAEADLITRREETAAMRSQANTARIFESNKALMRLRELEVLEKVADKAKLSVVLGEGGLADRVVKLL